jgi:radical SAM-linked protein
MRLRITFSKQGALRYTGHLDLHNLLERAARRAGLPLAYSQGFHPQPKINIASALPLGFSSRAEVMDIWLMTDCEIPRLRIDLQAALPTGIQILVAEQVDDRAPALQTQVVSAEYEVTLSEDTSTSPSASASNLTSRLAAIMEAVSLPRERRGKPYDLRPLIEELALTPVPSPREAYGRGGKIFMRLAAREGATGRPEEVLAELGIPVESARVERTRLLFQG